MAKSYMLSGVILAIIGFILAPISYFIIESIFLTAIGVSTAILGITSIGLAYTGSRTSPEARSVVFRTHIILLISLALAFVVIDVLLAFFNQGDIAVYFTLNAIFYFVIIWVYIALNPKVRTALIVVGAIIFTGFLVTMVAKIIEILK